MKTVQNHRQKHPNHPNHQFNKTSSPIFGLSEEDLVKIKECFYAFDYDNQGLFDLNDFKQLIKNHSLESYLSKINFSNHHLINEKLSFS